MASSRRFLNRRGNDVGPRVIAKQQALHRNTDLRSGRFDFLGRREIYE
jgi:hypothetical protein